MRILLAKNSRKKLFSLLLNKITNRELASICNVSLRTICDWKHGKWSISLQAFEKFIKISGLNRNEVSPKLLSDYWHVKSAAKKGARMRMKLYGNFGTPKGRRKGGLVSITRHREKLTNFKTLKQIIIPNQSEKLAEFLGILIGDGHLSKYQASVTTNAVTDLEHALFIKKLMKKLFGISSVMKIRKDKNTVVVVASSKTLVDLLNNLGMPIGNKIKNNLAVPIWILKNQLYQKAFLRGLFDTDGCVYLDIHKRNKKIYRYLGWTVTSYADKLIGDIIIILKELGFSPTYQATQKSVFLRRQNEIIKYFKDIGTSNLKHNKRYKKFIKLSGRVPKWS